MLRFFLETRLGEVKLVGELPPGTPEAGPAYDIVLEGDTFAYKRKVGEIVITYTGTVTGDTFTGKVDIGGFMDAPYLGERTK